MVDIWVTLDFATKSKGLRSLDPMEVAILFGLTLDISLKPVWNYIPLGVATNLYLQNKGWKLRLINPRSLYVLTEQCLFFRWVATNKMLTNVWPMFLIKFFLVFHMVACILFCNLHGSLINRLFQRFLLAVEENQPIKKWLKKLTESKTKATMWKSIENWFRNWCPKWHYILFGATHRKNKL